ncbi:MAG TPA: hypothetical protein VFG68_04575 [Fimbriiglobus sp.]|nr:hypothetical protein [Fimbriiglobus sp.]
MTPTELTPAAGHWTAAELRHLPATQRDAILLAAAERAGVDYHRDGDLTAFEAFGPGDLHGHSSDTQPR